MIQRIRENLEDVRARIARAEEASGAAAGSVTLVAVTKTRSMEEIEAALACGVTDIGENRVQEAQEKVPRLVRPVRRHLIGHLQRNKAKFVPGLFDLVQSVDSERLALALDECAAQNGARLTVLMQVNTSAEQSKSGVEPEGADRLLEYIATRPNLELRGLMTIGPLTDSVARIAASFRQLRAMFERYRSNAGSAWRMDILSMGMSSDYEIAIAEGANMVRVGTAIFGPRY
ncbi:YggS family pyridoxal phosphate-dependent enzyme [bacterium]|nr:YggS family pyridoxal phosphate-dependent enzyme [bacterium]